MEHGRLQKQYFYTSAFSPFTVFFFCYIFFVVRGVHLVAGQSCGAPTLICTLGACIGYAYCDYLYRFRCIGGSGVLPLVFRPCHRGNGSTECRKKYRYLWFVDIFSVVVSRLVSPPCPVARYLSVPQEVARKDQTKIRPNIYRTMYARCKAKGEKDLVVDIVLVSSNPSGVHLVLDRCITGSVVLERKLRTEIENGN